MGKRAKACRDGFSSVFLLVPLAGRYRCSVVGSVGRSCHDARGLLRHVNKEGGAAVVLDVSSFCRVGCGRILVRSTDGCESCPRGRRLIPAGGSKRAKRLSLSRRSPVCGGSPFAGAAPTVQSSLGPLFVGGDRAKKKCEQCPHFPPRTGRYCRRTGPDSACFRHFPVFPRPGIALRVPPRAQCFRRSGAYLAPDC